MEAGKTLYLVRHAKSSWSRPDVSDFDRPLNPRGLRDAPEMGRRMKVRRTLPDIIICSPAKRAKETLKYMELNVEQILFNDCVYGAAPGELLEIIRSIQERYNSAMLIGHNPAITLLAGRLSGKPIHNMPTCAIATVRLHCAQWSQTGACAAELLAYEYPKKQLE
jgi:phosphohistidine phosphatase